MTIENLDELLAALRAERPAVKVTLKRSSTKDGGEGWDIDATSNATVGDVEMAVWAALEARKQAKDALWPPVDPEAIDGDG